MLNESLQLVDDGVGVVGLGDEGFRSLHLRPKPVCLLVLAGHENDWNALGGGLGMQGPAGGVAVHARHHDIQAGRIRLGRLGFRGRLYLVGRCGDQ
mgnify:CR=1 FL=1